MQRVIEQAIELKEFQKDNAAAIDALRKQYGLLLEAHNQHEFLAENPYIRTAFLELQELMVKGGYLNPEEANKNLAAVPFNERMEAASQIFYELSSDYAPESLSPQHEALYEAAVEANQAQFAEPAKHSPIDLSESSNKLNLRTLSRSVAGLCKMALSYRPDAWRSDHLHPYYEKRLSAFQ